MDCDRTAQPAGLFIHRPVALGAQVSAQPARRQHRSHHSQLGHGAAELLDGGGGVLHRNQGHALEARVLAAIGRVQPVVVRPRRGNRPVDARDLAAGEPPRRIEHRGVDANVVQELYPLGRADHPPFGALRVRFDKVKAVEVVERRKHGPHPVLVELVRQELPDAVVVLLDVTIGVNDQLNVRAHQSPPSPRVCAEYRPAPSSRLPAPSSSHSRAGGNPARLLPRPRGRIEEGGCGEEGRRRPRCAKLPAMLDLPHADVVGSLIRPRELLAAREDLAAGRIAPPEFKRVEDAAVDQAVAAQEEAGLDILTDGEMRRLSFQSQMPEAVEGFGEFDLDAFLWGDWRGGERVGELRKERPSTLGVVGKLRRKRHLSAEEFTYLRGRTTRIAKVTLPSPSLFATSGRRRGPPRPTQRSMRSWPTSHGSSGRRSRSSSGLGQRTSSSTLRTTRSCWTRRGQRSTRRRAGQRRTGSPRASSWTTQ